jgi:hypothetical protein
MAAKKSLVLKAFQLLMWKQNLVVAKPTIKLVSVGVAVLCVLALAACNGEATPFVESTQVLIPSTATFTPSPVPPTATLDAALSAPEDITAVAPPDVTIAPDTAIAVDGYRIALSAGDNEYIFHTDFDRALPCDAANEQLPETTPEP